MKLSLLFIDNIVIMRHFKVVALDYINPLLNRFVPSQNVPYSCVYFFSFKTSYHAITFAEDQCPYVLLTFFNVLLEACLIHTLDRYK